MYALQKVLFFLFNYLKYVKFLFCLNTKTKKNFFIFQRLKSNIS